MEPLRHEDYWHVEIDWSQPVDYERLLNEGSPHDELAYLYLISARFGENASKSIYIGKTFRQWVSKRLSQPDHKLRRIEFEKKHPRHQLYASHGLVTINNGNITEKRIDEIERILIYANKPEYANNIQNFWQHKVTTPYWIENKGSRCTLPKTISLGVFVQY